MTETITSAISDRICNHMNKDHSDALILYAEYFGKISNIKNAKMLSIDNQAMYLEIDHNSENPLAIQFDHPLEDAKDAHNTLVAMMKEAQKTE
jgi:putative heme iron utilization protein